jgi:rubredoxin
MDLPSAACSTCGYVFSLNEPRRPCPQCGGTARHYDVELIARSKASPQIIAHKPLSEEQASNDVNISATDSAHLSEKDVAHGQSPSGEMVRVVDTSGESVVADQASDGSVQYSITGKSRQGETGNLGVCRTLIERLNREGDGWGEPTDTSGDSRTEEGVDCKAYHGNRVLNVQVTRAEIDQQIWRQLGQAQQVTSSSASPAEVAGTLCKPILAKAKKIITPAQRQEIVLALDATQSPIHGFQDIVQSFRQLHGQWAQGLGFRGIYVVGPTADLTARLDVSEGY